MKISYSIMAHPNRKEWAEELARELDCEIYWDTNNTIWHTCRGAWQLADRTSDYHFVIQDDAILCRNFKQRVQELVEKSIEHNGETAFQLYFGRGRFLLNKSDREKAIKQGYYVRTLCAWGVAIGMPTKLIDEMIRFGNGYYAWQDDTKIKNFLKSKGIKTVFPTPCLVDHKWSPTLTPCPVMDNYDRTSDMFIDSFDTIPKIIHQIWLGDKNLIPQKLIDTWKMNGWEHKLWTEEEVSKIVMKNKKLYDYFYDKKCYFGCSDVLRLEILSQYGGIYIDADTERLLPIDEIVDDGSDFFSVWSNKEGRIANGVIGAVPHHPIIENYIKEMGNASVVEPVWNTIGGTMFTDMIFKHQTKKSKILKPQTFYPFDSKGVKSVTRYRGKTYARHFWGSTHNLYSKGDLN